MLTTEWGPVGTRGGVEQGGGLVLVLLATRASGDCVEQPGRTPTRTSTRPPHLPHPTPCPYRLQDPPSPIRSAPFIRTLGRKHPNGEDSPIRSSTFISETGVLTGISP